MSTSMDLFTYDLFEDTLYLIQCHIDCWDEYWPGKDVARHGHRI